MPKFLQRLRFSPGWIPTLAALAVVLLTIHLGEWQRGRAAEKRLMQLEFDRRVSEPPIKLDASLSGADLRYRQGSARGKWYTAGEIFIDNKVSNGVAGYHVVTPLRLEGTNVYLLVNRGWIPRASTYPLPPRVPTPDSEVEVTGILSQPSLRFIELSADAIQGSVWQNLTIERYRKAMSLNVLPYVLIASSGEPSMTPVVEQPSAGADKHTEYMLTWYSLAVTVFVLWLVLNLHSINSDHAHDRANAREVDIK